MIFNLLGGLNSCKTSFGRLFDFRQALYPMISSSALGLDRFYRANDSQAFDVALYGV